MPLFKWQARRESNPQPAVLETAALPIEPLAYTLYRSKNNLTVGRVLTRHSCWTEVQPTFMIIQ